MPGRRHAAAGGRRQQGHCACACGAGVPEWTEWGRGGADGSWRLVLPDNGLRPSLLGNRGHWRVVSEEVTMSSESPRPRQRAYEWHQLLTAAGQQRLLPLWGYSAKEYTFAFRF